MSSFICIGDPHIGKSTNIGKSVVGSKLNSRIVDQIELLDWSLERAIHHNVTDIILTGDVFDDPKPPTAVITLFISWIKRCQINNIKVHVVMGNHDMLRSGNVYSSPLDIIEECGLEDVYIYRCMNTCIFENFAITFIPFKDRKAFSVLSNSDALDIIKNQLNYEVLSIPDNYKKIAIGHLGIVGSIPIGDEFDDLSNELLCPLELFEGYDYVWMGHIHKPQVMNNNPYIAHIGSMDISDFGETEHKKSIIIFDTNFPNNFIEEILPTRNLKKISYEVPESEEDPTQYIIDIMNEDKSDFNKSIIKLDVSLKNKDKSIDKSRIEKYLLGKGVHNIASISESRRQNSVKKEANDLSNKMDIITAIKKYSDTYIKEEDRSQYIDVALSIYNKFKEEEK